MDTEFDEERFYRAVDDRRVAEDLNWRQLARRLALSASTFSRLSRGHRPDVETFLRLLTWLQMPAEAFIRGQAPIKGPHNSDALSVIATTLRQDPSLRPEDIGPLEDIFRVVYRRFQRAPKL